MKFTNKYNLPAPFVRAVENDPYSKGDSDFTPSSLAEPARAFALLEKHSEIAVVDVSSRVASIIGQGTHSIAERAARPGIDICEKRLYMKVVVDGVEYTIGAQLDLFETDTCDLWDWKSTKAFAFSKKAGSGKKPEWVAQLNICAEILRNQPTPYYPKSLNIIALLKDWSIREAGTGSCPETEVVGIPLPMWSSADVHKYIAESIRAKVAARESLPMCTTKENWAGRKCGQWCDASSVCSQYQESLKTGLITKKAEGE